MARTLKSAKAWPQQSGAPADGRVVGLRNTDGSSCAFDSLLECLYAAHVWMDSASAWPSISDGCQSAIVSTLGRAMRSRAGISGDDSVEDSDTVQNAAGRDRDEWRQAFAAEDHWFNLPFGQWTSPYVGDNLKVSS